MFGKYGPLRTAHESYLEGRDRGLDWEFDYRPGGPWVCHATGMRSGDGSWEAYCQATAINNSEWLRGFRDGLVEARLSAR